MGLEIGVSSLGVEERIEFFRTLASWLTSGGGALPVHEAISNTCDVFSRDEYITLKRRMERVTIEFESGQMTFAQGLRQAALGFTAQELAIIDAAEKSNQLRTAIPSLVDALVMRQESGKMLKSKMMMPIVGGFMLLLMTIGVMVFMMPVVMEPTLQRDPTVLDNFPFIIVWFWNASVWFREFYVITVFILVAPIILFFIRNTPMVKPHFEAFLMRGGVTKQIVVAFNAVLIVYFMPALVRANMPLPDVLRTLANSLNNDTISSQLRKAAHDHEHGQRLGEVLGRLPLKGSFRSAVDAGEKTGKIAERVEDLKAPYRNDFERVTRRAVSALTMTVMIVLMPLFVVVMYTTLVTPMIALMEYA